jgi:L-lysine 2,3-aminomutase
MRIVLLWGKVVCPVCCMHCAYTSFVKMGEEIVTVILRI